MKKFLSILGGIFAVIVVIVIIVAAIFIPRALKLDREATAYIQDAVPKIVEHWNAQELIDLASPKLMSAVKSRGEIDRFFVMFRQLGALKHLDTPKGGVTSGTFSGSGLVTLGNYSAQADFEHGSATIQIQLRRVGDSWKIDGFHINSDAFLPHQP